jgi:hypothetical protein
MRQGAFEEMIGHVFAPCRSSKLLDHAIVIDPKYNDELIGAFETMAILSLGLLCTS